MNGFIRVVVFFLSLLLGTHAVAQELNAFVPLWLSELHMRRSGAAGWQSEIEDEGFFLSPAGRNSPEAEWRAATAAFSHSYQGQADMNPRCLFPARAIIWGRLSGVKLPPVSCPALRAFKTHIDAASVTVVHAAQYVEDPASLFGHIFLRFNMRNHGPSKLRLDPLAFSTGYFAIMPPDVSPIDYLTKGLTGGFTGKFLPSTYARSLLEYNRMENRELWEYDLALNDEQLERMLEHLWELVHFGKTSYRFLRENCAYQLLALVQASVDKSQLTADFSTYVIPADAVRSLEHAALILAVRHRPAQGSKLRHAVEHLNRQQWADVNALEQGKKQANAISDPIVLELAHDLIDYRTHQAQGAVSAGYAQLQRDILSARALLPVAADLLESAERPHRTIQGPGRISAGYAVQPGSDGMLLGLRPAMHDSLDRNAAGTGIALTLLDLKLLFAATRKAPQVQQLTLVSIENLRSFDRLDRGLAWRFKGGWQRDLWGEPSRQLHFGVMPSSGVATAPDSVVQSYLLLTTPLQLSSSELRRVMFGGGGILGLRLNVAQTVLGSLEVISVHPMARHTPWHTTIKSAGIVHLDSDFALAISWDKSVGKSDQRLELAIHSYF